MRITVRYNEDDLGEAIFSAMHEAGHAIQHSIERAKIDPAEVDEVVLGCGTPQGTTGFLIGANVNNVVFSPATAIMLRTSMSCWHWLSRES